MLYLPLLQHLFVFMWLEVGSLLSNLLNLEDDEQNLLHKAYPNQTEMKKIEIPLSKTKLTLITLMAFSFVLFSILFIIEPHNFVSPFLRSPELTRMVGFIGVLLFSTFCFFGIKKLFDKKNGLTIDEIGITDHTNTSSVGLIRWNNILEIRSYHKVSTKFLLIFINNPKEIIEQFSGMKKKILEGNMKMYGTPISITSTTLKYNFEDLKILLIECFDEQQKISNP